MGRKPQPSNKPVPDFLVGENRGVNPRGVSYDRKINDQMESLKSVGQFAWESLPGIGTAYTIQDIKDELAKEEPNYYMIGALAGAEVIGLIPGLGDAAAELIKKGAKSAGKLGSKIDRAVDQTTALLGGPKAKDVIKNEMAGFTGQNPPTYKKRDTPLSQQEDFEPDFNEDGVIKPKGIPSEKTRLRKDNILQFREPIAEFAKTVTIPKKGLLGSEFLKMIKKNESIADSSLQPQIIDPKRRYTREELLEAIGDDEGYPGPNVFRSETYIGERQGSFRNYQRQGQDAGFLGIGKELDYFELPVMSRPPSGSEGTGKPFKANSQHFDEDTIVHARGSIVQPADGVPVSFEYEDLIGQKPFLLVEEIQSDLLQKGYVKPSSLSDAAFKKATEQWSRDNVVSFREMFGDISKDIKNIFEELDDANIIRPDLVDGFSARDKFQRNAVNRGYVLSNELEEVLDKLNLTEEFIEPSITDLTRTGMNRDLPIVDVDTGAELSTADFTERFKKEKYLTPREKTLKFFDKSRELLAKKQLDKEINLTDFQNLYVNYKTNQYRIKQGGYHQDVGLPPITKNKQAVEESLKALIAKAAREGVDKIVIPPADRIARARERTLDFSDKSDRFYRTYVTDLNKALNDLEKNYPVEVRRNVEMPYDNRLSGPRKLEAIEQGLQTLSLRGELGAFTVSSPSVEVSLPDGMNYEILRQAMDREIHAENLTSEQEKVFRAFAVHNRVSFEEAPEVFSQWHVKQTDELFKKPWFQRMLPESDTNYGTILDISELVDQFKVEEPRQFAEGGSPRPKLRPGSDRKISPKPRLRPDPERQYGLAEVEARADFDPAMHWNPIARLGFTGFSSDKTGKGNEIFPPAFYFPSTMPKKRAIERAIANEIPYDKALTVEPDDIYIAPELANKRVWAHEMTHRGFDRIIESINAHPEGPSAGIKEFKDKYGDDTFRLLTAKTAKSHEGIVEMFDDLEDSVLRKAPEEEYLDDSSVDEIKRFQRTIKRKPEDRWQINKDKYRPYIKLMEAAQDMLTKAGEPPKSPDYEESTLDKLRIKLGFAEGGTVDMNQQMSFAFEDGGLRDDGMMRDPVSGNEVPPGSTAKEVRDDIPAQLSEGEYVVPADVVRYYGVKFFEDLRDNAKMGLQDMEARGRIGGEPVPAGGPMNEGDLSPEEMAAIQEMMGMAEGGTVNMYKQQQDLYSAPNPAIGNSVNMASGGQVRGYNQAGTVAPATDPTTTGITEQDFLQQGKQAQQSAFVGFPLGATIFPSAQQTTPTVVAFEPVNLIHPETFVKVVATTQEMYEQKLDEGYILDDGSITPPGTQVAPDDGGTPPPPGESKPAYEDWLNSADFNSEAGIEKFIAGISYDPSKSNLDMQTLGATVMGGPMAGLMTAAGGALRGGGLQAISDMRAASLIAKAQGLDELAGKIDAQVADIIKDGPDILDFLDDIFATGKQKANAWAKKNGHENIETATETGVTPKPPATAPTVEPKPKDDGPTFTEQLKAKQEKESTAATSLAKAKATGIAAKAKNQGKTIAEVSQTGSQGYGNESAASVATGGQGSQSLGSGAGGMNKGGLMATPKKKAKRQYKKGGLANKK